MRCGARLPRACARCGTEVPSEAAFCFACGNALRDPAVPARPPEAYTPRHLAEKILASKAALAGERKHVTVLFADLKGSLELLLDRDPEDARRLLDPVIEQMMEAVHRYEGTVNQVMGDGIMALFGAPVAHEDHAVRACFAALAMQESIKRYARAVLRQEGVVVQIRVGLNSGEVVVRAISNDLHMDYSAVGETTHLAARMEQIAAPGTTLMTASTLRLAEAYVETTARGGVPVKGLAEPVDVYELTDASPARRRIRGGAQLTPFVGRTTELLSLRLELERAVAGTGRVVAVIGEPGVGKSRLFHEFARLPELLGALVLETGAASYGQASAGLPIAELLRRYLHVEPADDPQAIRDTARGRLAALDPRLLPLLPALLVLLGVADPDEEWRALGAAERRGRAVEAFKRLVLRESQVQPVVLLVEDLHWVDGETQAILDSLVESVPTARVLLLVNYRPEYRHPWGAKTYYSRVQIDRLAPGSAGALIESLLGSDPGLEPARQVLAARTDGNPFFIEETIRTLVETDVLAGTRGAYRLARPLRTIQVPPTVQAVLAARIDRLAPEDKRLLQSAAVVGKDVPLGLLRAIADEADAGLRERLARLQSAELLYETQLFPEVEYTFKHALTHEVAYGSVLRERRLALHGRLVDAIEALGADRAGEHVERLAQHALGAERWDRAVDYARRAGARAFARSAHRSAAAWFESALDVLRHLPESDRALEQAIDIRLDLRYALSPLGEFPRLLERLGEAEQLATRLADRSRLGRITSYLANYYQVAGDLDRAIHYGQRAVETSADADVRVVAASSLTLAYQTKGDYEKAVALARATLADLAGAREREWFGMAIPPAVYLRVGLVRALAEVGEFGEALAVAEQGLAIAEDLAHAYSLMFACLGLGIVHLWRGDATRATPLLERSLSFCARAESPSMAQMVAAFLALARVASGRAEEALSLLEEAQRGAASVPIDSPQAAGLDQLARAEARLAIGRIAEAEDAAARARDAFTRLEARGYQAWALWMLGRAAARRAAPEAEGWLVEACSVATDLGMRPLMAHCHLALGELCGSLGSSARARRELAAAIVAYRDLDMPKWRATAESALANLT